MSAETDWDLISSYAGLLSLATLSIYAGSLGSVTLRKHPQEKGATAVDEEEDEEEIPDRLTSQDAYLFPVIGSVVLFCLYLVVKHFGKEWINWLLQWYFTFAGIGSVGKSLVSLARWTIGKGRWRKLERVQFLCLKGRRELVSFSLRTPSFILIPLGALPSIVYNFGPGTTRRSGLLTDILALSFAHNAISLMKIDSFQTGCVLLSGLFLYDIWWVFGTDVMVAVATTLDVPIKILWPKSLIFSTERGFTMLGLGDIVVPGMFIALALRYDYHRSDKAVQGSSFSKPYFYAGLLAYVTGLMTTMGVMHFFGHAQPALLYLSPACMISFFVTAFAQGDFTHAWAWSDEAEKPKTDEGKTETPASGVDPGPAVAAAADDTIAPASESQDKTVHDSDEGTKKPKTRG
ncbi:signal peptide peptidase-domain-containing protein [Fomitopsis serialis]|uniref:signal peptide peptidase-domain-containing protein n=1 Tax=Fomitopsis serialis TaxID=139415 RepID=UPI0020076069|nr:signal peptide peptidase-domain-containing protein [Neoantrodia serialis]KAH9911597.1 signal peptide peptidase-domain-containing protein [Neoantrodia serialis]